MKSGWSAGICIFGLGKNSEMNINILTIGTRGDVQPYIALGLGLKVKGHAEKIYGGDYGKGDSGRSFRC